MHYKTIKFNIKIPLNIYQISIFAARLARKVWYCDFALGIFLTFAPPPPQSEKWIDAAAGRSDGIPKHPYIMTEYEALDKNFSQFVTDGPKLVSGTLDIPTSWKEFLNKNYQEDQRSQRRPPIVPFRSCLYTSGNVLVYILQTGK